MTCWKCACGCGHAVEADKAPKCCGKQMVKTSKEEMGGACGCC
jgi:hypothetical protein